MSDQQKNRPQAKIRFSLGFSSLFIQELRYTVEKRQNLVVNVFGPSGSVKRETAQNVAMTLQDFFTDQETESSIQIRFGFVGTRLNLLDLGPGNIVIQDEFTTLSG